MMTVRELKGGGVLVREGKNRQVPLMRKNGQWIVNPRANTYTAGIKDPVFLATAIALTERRYPSKPPKPQRKKRKSIHR